MIIQTGFKWCKNLIAACKEYLLVVQTKVLLCRHILLAAGAIGTPEILFKSKQTSSFNRGAPNKTSFGNKTRKTVFPDFSCITKPSGSSGLVEFVSNPRRAKIIKWKHLAGAAVHEHETFVCLSHFRMALVAALL